MDGGLGLPLQPPQDAVGPRGLALFLTGGGRRGRMGREGVAGEQEGTHELAGCPNTRACQQSRDHPGPELETSMAAGRRVSNGTKSMLAFVRLSQGPSVD